MCNKTLFPYTSVFLCGNRFYHLLVIITSFFTEGVVTEDCLILMHNLIKSNVSNQNFFREGRWVYRFWYNNYLVHLHILLILISVIIDEEADKSIDMCVYAGFVVNYCSLN